jgi:uncharacterized repeat protein (TIGR02543 family)
MTRTGYRFGGWYKEAVFTNLWNFAADTVSGNIILYAQWEPGIVVSGETLAAQLQWLYTNAESNSRYLLEVTAVYEELAPQTISYPGRSNITVQLKGTGNEKIIGLLGTGSLLSIGNGVTLILDDNLTLVGKNNNTASLVTVASGGNLIMNKGAKITGNRNASTQFSGGGVYVAGTFTMNGGEITGNYSNIHGGGVYVAGTFTMNGGEISGNTASNSYGGGVYVYSGTFTKSGGTITGNGTVNGNSARSGGNAVYVDSSPVKRRESTAGPEVNMDSRISGAAGGWED